MYHHFFRIYHRCGQGKHATKVSHFPAPASRNNLPKCRTSPPQPPKTCYQSVVVGQKTGIFTHFLPKSGVNPPRGAQFVSKRPIQNALWATGLEIVENGVQPSDIQRSDVPSRHVAPEVKKYFTFLSPSRPRFFVGMPILPRFFRRPARLLSASGRGFGGEAREW